MIDIHTHLLPAVDDGSRTFEQSLAVLDMFVQSGVEVVVCTPHLDASAARRAPHDKHRLLLSELAAQAPDSIRLLSGWEIMLDLPGADLTDPRLCLGDSTAILVEFPRLSLPPNAAAELFRIRMSGRVPVVAHPERYHGCSATMVREWKGAGAVIQVDVAAVLRSPRRQDLALRLLAEGLVDCFASDTHGDSRALGPARRWMEEMGADRQAELLTKTNAGRVLQNLEPLPVPPMELKRSVVDRLRDLLRRS